MGIVKIIIIIALLYLVFIVIVGLTQTSIIFLPQKLDEDHRFDSTLHGTEVYISTMDGEKINALLYKGNRKEIILYFHGNAGNLSSWQYIANDFSSVGYHVLMIDYRGYGKSSGSISEEGLYSDAAAAYQFVIDKGFESSDIIVWGRSIGTGIAVDLASKRPVKGLVLEAPFVSMKALASEKAPYLLPKVLLKYQFNNIEKINAIHSPIMFIHGDQDTLIPSSHGVRLNNHFIGKKKLIMINQGGHNNLNSFPAFQQAIHSMDDLFMNN